MAKRGDGRRIAGAPQGILDLLPSVGAVVDDACAHSAGPGDDFVVLAGIRRVAEQHHQIPASDIDRAMNPVGRHIADRQRFDGYDPDVTFGRFHQHKAAALLSVIDFRPIGLLVDMSTRQEELVPDLAR